MSWRFNIISKFGIDVISLVPSTLTAEITPQIPLIVVVACSVITNESEILKVM